jgi:hypothetical protein
MMHDLAYSLVTPGGTRTHDLGKAGEDDAVWRTLSMSLYFPLLHRHDGAAIPRPGHWPFRDEAASGRPSGQGNLSFARRSTTLTQREHANVILSAAAVLKPASVGTPATYGCDIAR